MQDKVKVSFIMTHGTTWLAPLNAFIDQHLDNPKLNNKDLAQEMDLSIRQLNRRVKIITGYTPHQYLQQYRLAKAKSFMEVGHYHSVQATAYAIGYTNVSYFIRQFEYRYQVKPLALLQQNGWR